MKAEPSGTALTTVSSVSSFQPQPDYPISARFRLRQLASEYARLRRQSLRQERDEFGKHGAMIGC